MVSVLFPFESLAPSLWLFENPDSRGLEVFRTPLGILAQVGNLACAGPSHLPAVHLIAPCLHGLQRMPPQRPQNSDLPLLFQHSHQLAEGPWPASCGPRACSPPGLQPSPAKPLPLLLRGDLRLKEYEDEDQQSGQGRSKHHPMGKLAVQTQRVDDPAPGSGIGHFEAIRYRQFL